MKIPIDELRFLEREKGIALETVIGALESALAAAYKRRLRLKGSPRNLSVRVTDGAGNASRWKKVKVVRG